MRTAIACVRWIFGLFFRERKTTLVKSGRVMLVDSTSPLLSDENLHNARVEAAMSLTDDDAFGYIVMVLKKPNEAIPDGEIVVHGSVREDWWPAFAAILSRTRKVGLQHARL